MPFPPDYHGGLYPDLMKKHRLTHKDIVDKDDYKAREVDSIVPDNYVKEEPPIPLKSAVHFVPCLSEQTLVPVSKHPHMTKRLAGLEYLFEHSTREPAQPIQISTEIPLITQAALIRNSLSLNHPVWLQGIQSRYPSKVFDIPTKRPDVIKSQFYRWFSPTNLLKVYDTLHPHFSTERVQFEVSLQCIAEGMYDAYACLHTLAGLPTVGMCPPWLSWMTGVPMLVQEVGKMDFVPEDLCQLQEHLAISRPLCFSGLVVDPHGMCCYDLVESGIRYVFYLSCTDHLTEARLEECMQEGSSPGEMELSAEGIRVAKWHVVKLRPGDLVIFPPGAMRFHYSPVPTFTTSGSFLSRSLLDRTAEYFLRGYHIYPRQLRSFPYLVLGMLWLIRRECECTGGGMTLSQANTIKRFLELPSTFKQEDLVGSLNVEDFTEVVDDLIMRSASAFEADALAAATKSL